MDILYASGFAFLREVKPGLVEFENKFTGLRITYNIENGMKVVGEVAV